MEGSNGWTKKKKELYLGGLKKFKALNAIGFGLA